MLNFKDMVSHAMASPVVLLLLLAASCRSAPQTASEQTPPEQEQQQQRRLLPAESPYYYVGCYTARTDLYKESVYAKTPQTCVEICEHQTHPFAVLAAEKCFCAEHPNEQERQDEQLCNTRCLANKAQYCGGVGVHSYYATSAAKGSAMGVVAAPQQLRLAAATANSLTLSWQRYERRKMFIAGGEVPSDGGPQEVTNFLIRSKVVYTYSTLPFFPQPEFIVQSTETGLEINDLHPATEYNVSVAAICGPVECGGAWLLATTAVGVPSPAPPQPRLIDGGDNDDGTMSIEIPPLHNDNGPLTRVLVVVERVDAALSQPFDEQLLGDWHKAQDDGLPYYIAAELDYTAAEQANRTRRFLVGDGKLYGRYTNAPLEGKRDERHIHISLGVVSSLNGITRTLYTRSTHAQHTPTLTSLEDFTYADFDSGNQSIVALTVTCVVFGTCLLLSILTYFYLRYKTAQTRGGGRSRNAHEMTMQQPIIERENNGYDAERGGSAAGEAIGVVENFKSELDNLLERLPAGQRLARSGLRMNVNDVLADGRYGEVISGKLLAKNDAIAGGGSGDCQLHVLALDEIAPTDQAHLLRELRNVLQLQQPRQRHLLDFYGVSASADWFYVVFEHQSVSLKRRLVDSRRVAISSPVQRMSSLSELLVLQWMYELASAMEYVASRAVVLRQLCSYHVFLTAEGQLKVALFGPVHNASNGGPKAIDLTRWLAPEVLRYQHYSTKSDVWSFACVAWECCALGGTPYANIAQAAQLLDAIRGGSRPAQPAYVYHDLYQLLLNCWQLEPSERITFEEVTFAIRQLMTSPRHALCFDRAPDQSPLRANGNEVLDVLPFYLPLMEVVN